MPAFADCLERLPYLVLCVAEMSCAIVANAGGALCLRPSSGTSFLGYRGGVLAPIGGVKAMSDQDNLGVYSRRPGESQKAFAACCEHRDMGAGRSQEAVSKKLAKSRPILNRWSARWGWVERASA
jgi:hypothetical protein